MYDFERYRAHVYVETVRKYAYNLHDASYVSFFMSGVRRSKLTVEKEMTNEKQLWQARVKQSQIGIKNWDNKENSIKRWQLRLDDREENCGVFEWIGSVEVWETRRKSFLLETILQTGAFLLCRSQIC